MKNPVTPAGIEPATFRFVAQYLNQCATAVPLLDMINLIIIGEQFHHGTPPETNYWKSLAPDRSVVNNISLGLSL